MFSFEFFNRRCAAKLNMAICLFCVSFLFDSAYAQCLQQSTRSRANDIQCALANADTLIPCSGSKSSAFIGVIPTIQSYINKARSASVEQSCQYLEKASEVALTALNGFIAACTAVKVNCEAKCTGAAVSASQAIASCSAEEAAECSWGSPSCGTLQLASANANEDLQHSTKNHSECSALGLKIKEAIKQDLSLINSLSSSMNCKLAVKN